MLANVGLLLVLTGISALLLVSSTLGLPANSPSTVWLGAWAFAVAALVALAGPYTVELSTLVVVTGLVASVPFGAFFARATSLSGLAPSAAAVPVPVLDLRRLSQLKLVSGLLGLVGAAAMAGALGTPLGALVQPDRLAEAAAGNAHQIFGGGLAPPPVAKLGFAFTQFGFALTGLGLSQRRPRLRQLGPDVVVASSAVVLTLLTTQRSYTLAPLVWLVAGWSAGLLLAGRPLQVSFRLIARSSAAAIGLLGAAVTFRSLRTGDAAAASADPDAFRVWIAGYLPGFDQWYRTWSGPAALGAELSYGVRTLLGLTADTGSEDLFMTLSNGDTTNALTLLRFAVEDFGPFGAMVVLGALGFVLERCASRAAAAPARMLTPVVAGTALVLWAPNSWFFDYGGRVLVVVMLAGASRVLVGAPAVGADDPSPVTPRYPFRPPWPHHSPDLYRPGRSWHR